MNDDNDDAYEYNLEEDSSLSGGEVDDATLFAVIYLIYCYIHYVLRHKTLLKSSLLYRNALKHSFKQQFGGQSSEKAGEAKREHLAPSLIQWNRHDMKNV
jgi:hypothetical protein